MNVDDIAYGAGAARDTGATAGEATVDGTPAVDRTGSEEGCLCCGQPLPQRAGARGGPRLRYCPEGEGRWDDGTFSCKRHGAAVVAYRAARGEGGIAGQPLTVLDQTLTQLRTVLAPVTASLADTTAVVERQQQVVREETLRIAEADAHAEHATRAAAAAERARLAAEAAAATDRDAANQARTERDRARAQATADRTAATEATERAAIAEQARRDAATAAADAITTRDAMAGRVEKLTELLDQVTADRDTVRAELTETRHERDTATATATAAQRDIDTLTTQVTTLTADRDRLASETAHLTTAQAVARSTLEVLTTAATRQAEMLTTAQRAHASAIAQLHALRHLAAAVPDTADHPTTRALLDTLHALPDPTLDHPPGDLLTTLARRLAAATDERPPTPDTLDGLTEVALTCLREHTALASGPGDHQDRQHIRAALGTHTRGQPDASPDWNHIARHLLADLALTARLTPLPAPPPAHDPAAPPSPDTRTLRLRLQPLTDTDPTHPLLATAALAGLRLFLGEATRVTSGHSTAHTSTDPDHTTTVHLPPPTSTTALAYLTELATRLGFNPTTHTGPQDSTAAPE